MNMKMLHVSPSISNVIWFAVHTLIPFFNNLHSERNCQTSSIEVVASSESVAEKFLAVEPDETC